MAVINKASLKQIVDKYLNIINSVKIYDRTYEGTTPPADYNIFWFKNVNFDTNDKVPYSVTLETLQKCINFAENSFSENCDCVSNSDCCQLCQTQCSSATASCQSCQQNTCQSINCQTQDCQTTKCETVSTTEIRCQSCESCQDCQIIKCESCQDCQIFSCQLISCEGCQTCENCQTCQTCEECQSCEICQRCQLDTCQSCQKPAP